jgi:hypothetical protein
MQYFNASTPNTSTPPFSSESPQFPLIHGAQNQITATVAIIPMPTATIRFHKTALCLASFAGTADGNINPVVLVPSTCTAPTPIPALAGATGLSVEVIKNPFESNDLGAGVAAESMVTKIGKPCSSHLVATSGPEANEETGTGEEGYCALPGW